MKLNDTVIAHIAKLLQIGILTGTDIVDQLRTIRLQHEDGELFLDTNYSKNADANIEKMLSKANKLTE